MKILLREHFFQTPGKYFVQDRSRTLQNVRQILLQICLEYRYLKSLLSVKSTKSDLQEFQPNSLFSLSLFDVTLEM